LNRRLFYKYLFAGTASLTIAPVVTFSKAKSATKKKTIRPKRLQTGQTVGLIAPGSSIDEERLQKAIQTIQSLGLKAKYTPNILAERGYLAGTDKQRLSDLHQMFSDPTVDAVWCIRGGYGCTRLLPFIDYKLIRKNPKILLGYSDITALLEAVHQKTGLVGFHGPVAVSEPTDYTLNRLRDILFAPKPEILITNAKENTDSTEKNYAVKVIRPGKASGKLVGGNLSLVTSLLGTPYQPCVKNKLLFLEDVGEKPYRIDRMLTQLRQTLDLNKSAGIILGIFADCEGGDRSLTLMETLEDRLGDLKVPIIYGMSFGHIDHQFTLPVGINAVLDTQNASIKILGPAVV
jgi:muramoyltetrapeptide carboxypeptidase